MTGIVFKENEELNKYIENVLVPNLIGENAGSGDYEFGNGDAWGLAHECFEEKGCLRDFEAGMHDAIEVCDVDDGVDAVLKIAFACHFLNIQLEDFFKNEELVEWLELEELASGFNLTLDYSYWKKGNDIDTNVVEIIEILKKAYPVNNETTIKIFGIQNLFEKFLETVEYAPNSVIREYLLSCECAYLDDDYFSRRII